MRRINILQSEAALFFCSSVGLDQRGGVTGLNLQGAWNRRFSSPAEGRLAGEQAGLAMSQLYGVRPVLASVERGVNNFAMAHNIESRRHSISDATNRNNSLLEALDGFVGSQHLLMGDGYPFKEIAGDQAVELYLGALSQLVYYRVFFGKRRFELGICT